MESINYKNYLLKKFSIRNLYKLDEFIEDITVMK